MGSEHDIDSVEWYVRKGGQPDQTGPFRREQLIRMWKQGALVSRDLLFAEGILPDWVRAGRLLHLFAVDETRPPNPVVVIDPGVPEELFLFENGRRRGPVSFRQLQVLVQWGEVRADLHVCTEDGQQGTTVGELLRTGKWAPRGPVESAGTGDGGPEPAVDRQARRRPRPPPRPASRGRRRRIARPGATPPGRPPPLPPAGPQEAFMDLLDEAVSDQRRAGGADGALPPPTSAPRKMRKRRPKKTQQAKPVGDHPPAAAADEEDLQSGRNRRQRSIRRLLRTPGYSRACTLWSAIYLVQALVFLTASNAVFGILLGRMGGLCLSTFIPFGPTPEELKQEALLVAGFSTVLVGAAMGFPLWHLLRTDCLPWHCIASMLMGLSLGFAMNPELIALLFSLARAVLILGSIGLGCVAVWLMFSIREAYLYSMLLVPLVLTGLSIGGLVACDVQQVLILNIPALPPGVHGTLLHSGGFLLSLYVATLAFPGFCYCVLSGEVTRPVKEFMDSHGIAALACGAGAAATAYFLLHPQPEQFISIPCALVPLAAINAVVCAVPPVLWLLHPDSVGIR